MKNKYKRILLFVIVLCIFSMAIAGCASETKMEESEKSYQEMLEKCQVALSALEEKTAELKTQKENLEKENKELQTKLTQALSEKSDITTQSQAMADLMDIYSVYKSGKTTEALEKIKMIEPMGFDDETLAFYEILKNILEK